MLRILIPCSGRLTTSYAMTTTKNQFAIFRIKKLRTPEEISKVGTHNDRRGKLPDNVDPSRVDLNRSFVNDARPLLDRVRAKLAGKKYRHDAVKAVEIVCGFSPGCERFVPLDEWAKTSIDFIKTKFGSDNLVSAVLHLDEKTPHLQCVIVPLVDERLAAKRIFGTRQKMRDLQTCYHDAVKKFGLIRGTKGSSRPHLSMQEMYQGTQEGMEIVKATLDALPKKSPLESWKNYSEKLRQHVTTALKPLAAAKTAATLAGVEIQSLRKLAAESEAARKAASDRLRSLDLEEVAKRLLGYEGIKEGEKVIFEDDARKIVITGNSFRDEKSTARGERGAISLTRHILGVDFETAVRVLSQHFPEDSATVTAEAVRGAEESLKSLVKKSAAEQIDTDAKIKHFATPDKNKLPIVIEYLEKIRAIPRRIINALVFDSKLWANRWGSVCFRKEAPEGRHRGVSILSTTTGTVQSLGKSSTLFHFGNFDIKSPVGIVESPIDALSYHAKTGNPVIATDGTSTSKEVVKFLKAVFTRKAIIALKDDPCGQKLATELLNETRLARIESERIKPPKRKGWNDVLLRESGNAEGKVLNPKLPLPEIPPPPVAL